MKYIASITLFSFTVLSATQSHALSCAASGFDLETVFKANKIAGQNTVYVLGSFSGKINKAKPLQKPAVNGLSIVSQKQKAATSNLTFSGKVMTKNGTKPFKQNVKVTSSCVASWCGNIPKPGQKTIAAITKTNAGYTMVSGPCNPNTFSRQINTDWNKLKRLVR